MRILLAGGAVRDRLLGRPVTDRDFLVLEATREEFLSRFPRAKAVGKAFPVFILNGSEYAFPRGTTADGGPNGSPDDGLATDLTVDLALRDLTVNALAQEEDGTLHAHPLALQDLKDRVLRPASERSMSDDPLRVFRAARFLAELEDFTAHPDLLTAMDRTAASGSLSQATADRVGAELRKALRAPRPGRFLELLDQAGCLAPWFAELAQASKIPAGPQPFHQADVLTHVREVMDRLAGDELAGYMALCHDLGKTLTRPEDWPRHIGHETRGAPLAQALGERLRLPAAFIKAGVLAARWHMIAARYPGLRPGTKTDLLMLLHSTGLCREMFRLARADHGHDHLEEALADTETILQVTLEQEDKNQGQSSGLKLRQLRSQALAAWDRPPPRP